MKPNIRIAAAALAYAASFVAMEEAEYGHASPAQVETATARTAGEALRADVDRSRVYIKVSSASRLGHDHGVSGHLESGWLTPGSGGRLVFAMKTFITDSPDAREFVGLSAAVKPADQKKSSSNMLGPDVLDVERYPRATFDIQGFEPLERQAVGEPGAYKLRGTFTLHGVSRPIAVNAKLEPTKDPRVSRLRGSFAIRQSQFGITPYSALAGLVSIQDKLDIWGELILRQPVATANTSGAKAKH
jgi:hypothetical protein